MGSLATALASYLQARAHQGRWLIRIDDIDTPRVKPGSADSIIASLEAFGLRPDEPVIYQSNHLDIYADAVDRLLDAGLAFHCGCSRADLNQDGSYPGTCRNGLPAGKQPRSIRLAASPEPIIFTDLIAGTQCDDITHNGGDFVVRRADGLFAYQLCTAIDDAAPGITEVVRGADLLPSTSPQIHVQQSLHLTTPRYAHIPVITDAHGNKLSKRHADDPISEQQPAPALRRVLTHLAHPPPENIAGADGLLAWALRHWDIRRLTAAGSASNSG